MNDEEKIKFADYVITNMNLYYQEALIGDADMLSHVMNSRAKDNFDSLVARAKNFKRRLENAEKIEAMYREDTMKAYRDAKEEADKSIKNNMTKAEAIKLVRDMTLGQICDFENYGN